MFLSSNTLLLNSLILFLITNPLLTNFLIVSLTVVSEHRASLPMVFILGQHIVLFIWCFLRIIQIIFSKIFISWRAKKEFGTLVNPLILAINRPYLFSKLVFNIDPSCCIFSNGNFNKLTALNLLFLVFVFGAAYILLRSLVYKSIQQDGGVSFPSQLLVLGRFLSQTG